MNYVSLKDALSGAMPPEEGVLRVREVRDYFERLSIRRNLRAWATFLVTMGSIFLGLNAKYILHEPGLLQWFLVGIVGLGFPAKYWWQVKRVASLPMQKRQKEAHDLWFGLGCSGILMILVLPAILVLKLFHLDVLHAILVACPVTIPGTALMVWWLSGNLRKYFDPYYME